MSPNNSTVSSPDGVTVAARRRRAGAGIRGAASTARPATGRGRRRTSSSAPHAPQRVVASGRRRHRRPVPRRGAPCPGGATCGHSSGRTSSGDRRAGRAEAPGRRASSSEPASRSREEDTDGAGGRPPSTGLTVLSWPEVIERGPGRAGASSAVRHVPRALRQHVEDTRGVRGITSTAARSHRTSASPRSTTTVRSSGYVLGSTYTYRGRRGTRAQRPHRLHRRAPRISARRGIARVAAAQDLAGRAAPRPEPSRRWAPTSHNRSNAHLLYERLGYLAVENQYAYRIDAPTRDQMSDGHNLSRTHPTRGPRRVAGARSSRFSRRSPRATWSANATGSTPTSRSRWLNDAGFGTVRIPAERRWLRCLAGADVSCCWPIWAPPTPTSPTSCATIWPSSRTGSTRRVSDSQRHLDQPVPRRPVRRRRVDRGRTTSRWPTWSPR